MQEQEPRGPPVLTINLSNLTVDCMVSNLGMKPMAFVGARVAHPLVYSHGGRAIQPYTVYFSPEHSLLALKMAAKLSFQESLKEFPRLVDALLEWERSWSLGGS